MARRNTPLPLLKEIEIIDAGAQGKAVARVNQRVVFVPFAAPGDVVDVQVIKKKKGNYEGVITKLYKKSPYRSQPKCEHFGLCGGCKWQHMDYDNQKFFKEKQVKDNLDHIAKVAYPEIRPIIGVENPFYYRNKLEFTFSDKRWLQAEDFTEGEKPANEMKALGFHLPGKFDKILDINHCYLQKDPSNAIRLAAKEYGVRKGLSFYNIREQKGFLRNLIIRTASTGDLMVVMIFGEDNEAAIQEMMEFLAGKFPEITSLMYVINTKVNDVIYDLDVHLFKGKDFNLEVMPGATPEQKPLQFKVGPKSFYQTNPEQAHVLYKTAFDFAEFKGHEKVYDLYTGTGTIALFMAPFVKEVIGIESVKEAVIHARKNAEENEINNVSFHAGDMAKLLDENFLSTHGQPDIIVTDPPRAGMHPKVIQQILKAAPEKIVYVSCNPATQARDIAEMDALYEIKKVQPVDMFPQTHHVENVILLVKRSKTE